MNVRRTKAVLKISQKDQKSLSRTKPDVKRTYIFRDTSKQTSFNSFGRRSFARWTSGDVRYAPALCAAQKVGAFLARAGR